MNAARVELWLRFNNKYRRALSIPLNDTQHFALFPLAWLSHVAYTIYGSVGYLSADVDEEEPEELNCHTATMQGGNKYYYVAQDPRLLDPDLMDDRTSFATAYTTRRADFRQRVVDRDGTCILCGAENVQACHIVPHSKGNEYMMNVLNIRSEEILDPPFDEIDDPRNGILLNPAFQRGFGESHVAFLRTPNIFMTVDEVPLVEQPNAQQVHALSTPPEQKRLTFQHFDISDLAVMTLAPHNCDARLPDHDDWPPDVIFDAAYGIAALKTWGTKTFLEFIRNSTRDIYHNGEDAGGGESDRGDDTNKGNRVQRPPEDGRSERAERAANRARKRNGSRQASADFHDMLLGIWKLNAREGQRKARDVKAERTKEKVQTWLDSPV